jgi:flagellin
MQLYLKIKKQSLKTEMNSLLTGINGIKARTKFGDTTLLDGNAISIYSSNVSTDSVTITASGLANIATTGTNGTVLFNSVAALASNYSAALAQSVASAASTYISGLDTQRGVLGAIQNQMEYSVNNITELSANLTSARSRITDTDYATETASLTKGQILQQAATAMLAQANQMPNVILSLLK